MNYIFRKLDDSELLDAYTLHCKLVEKMLLKGIRQWLNPIDKEKLIIRQKRCENFGLYDEKNSMKVFLSLVKRTDYHEWAGLIKDKETIWLNTVSVNINNEQRGLGKIAIEHACDYLKSLCVKELFLDCVINDGFLVNYYSDLGFEVISKQTVEYRSGVFHVALMKKTL